MDIHKPKHPIDSARAFAVEIVTVTVGILIALGLEALIEAAHHRHIAEQARAAFREELAENRRHLASNLASIRKAEPQFQVALGLVSDRLAGAPEKNEPTSLDLNTQVTSISSSAWDNAQATLAFSYLKPGETRALAAAHSDVQTFQTLEAQALQAGVGITGLAGDPRGYDKPQLREAYRVISAADAYLKAIEGLEVTMLKHIDDAQKALKP